MSKTSKPLGFFGLRKLKKLKKHLLHEAHHALYFREDIAEPALINRVKDAEKALENSWQGGRGEAQAIEDGMDELHEATRALLPPGKSPKARENVEVALVAIGIALAFRTYFIQPFKIPTGSMQPSLYGITYEPETRKEIFDFFPLNMAKLLATGERYIEKKAPADGQISIVGFNESTGEYSVKVGNKNVRIHKGLKFFYKPNDIVSRGQILASGVRKSGDQILVDKVRYNFMRPKRGQVVVFNTHGIQHPQIKVDQFYIKRLVALPQEKVGIVKRKLNINGKEVSEPKLFKGREYNLVPNLMIPRPKFMSENDTLYLANDEFLMFGDNTYSSLDGRYFGAVKEDKLVGPAFAVHWPFFKRMGSIKSIPVQPPS